jgi:hypothetical protein
MWRGSVLSATRGKRGQRFFRDLVGALDEMPTKRLIKNELQTPEGEVCALGCLGRKRGIDLSAVELEEDPYDFDFRPLGAMFDINARLAREVMYNNDEGGPYRPGRYAGGQWIRDEETPEERWTRVRGWAARQIIVTESELLPSALGEGGVAAVAGQGPESAQVPAPQEESGE